VGEEGFGVIEKRGTTMKPGLMAKLKNPARRVKVWDGGDKWYLEFKKLEGRKVETTRISLSDDAMEAMVYMYIDLHDKRAGK
jgi:hypothetical protein